MELIIVIALQLKLQDNSECPHTIYFKEHSVREHTADKPSGRTLFIVNIPPYADEKGIANAFSEAGKVKLVQLCLKPNDTDSKNNSFMPEIPKPTFRIGYVIFNKVAELDRALKLTELKPMNNEEHKIKLGIDKWVEDYNNSVMTEITLKNKVEEFMKHFDKASKKSEATEKELEKEDDDGWITVTKKGKVSSFARSEKVENKIMQKEEKSKKRKELKNFYTFQIRESKMKHIVSLRQKFEEDKKKIALIKQSRRFKPF